MNIKGKDGKVQKSKIIGISVVGVIIVAIIAPAIPHPKGPTNKISRTMFVREAIIIATNGSLLLPSARKWHAA